MTGRWVVVALAAFLGLAGCVASPPSTSASPSSMSSPSVSTTPPQSASESPSATKTSQVTVPPATNSSPAQPATRVIVLRPVHHGEPANGFVATPQAGHTLAGCNGASRGAVSPGIYDCGISADYGVACWRAAAPATMYCLQDPFGQQLAQISLTDTSTPVSPPPIVASPLGLVLDDGAHCSIRDGGSWAYLPGHPNWYGTYFCNTTNDQILWGSGTTDGIKRTTSLWTVMATAKASTTLVPHAVVVAYFAGS